MICFSAWDQEPPPAGGANISPTQKQISKVSNNEVDPMSNLNAFRTIIHLTATSRDSYEGSPSHYHHDPYSDEHKYVY